eukprot:TRINITY_DN13270_c0_g2_i1.p1 TRINITY_DN13270_c0_g2~~TRINITY_DN13270_c0_g2_i1.p1  ORF type:complete len:397 (+),score=74.95 TRINITY_DN13270_c0_g2_i1:1224-2414(+)
MDKSPTAPKEVLVADSWHTVIVDVGSQTTRAGVIKSGDDNRQPRPTLSFPSVVGRHTQTAEIVVGMPELMTTEYESTYPMRKHAIVDWDGMERIWEHCFKELHVQIDDSKVFICEPSMTSSEDRERMAELMFEKFQFQGFCSKDSALLSLVPITTGIVVDVGYDSTRVVPVYEGKMLDACFVKVDYGGDSSTRFLQEHLHLSDSSIAEQVKHSLGFLVWDYEAEMEEALPFKETFEYPTPSTIEDKEDLEPLRCARPTEIQLSDSIFKLGKERFQCTEVLLSPEFAVNGIKSIPQAIADNAKKVPSDIRLCPLFKTVIVTGGSSQLPGLALRLSKEVIKLMWSCNMAVQVRPSRRHSEAAWFGAAVLSKCKMRWITKAEYDETGPSILSDLNPRSV